MKIITAILITLILSGCLSGCDGDDQGIVCMSNGEMAKVTKFGQPQQIYAPKHLCTMNPDGSFTVRNKP